MRIHPKVTASHPFRDFSRQPQVAGLTVKSPRPKFLNLPSQVSDALERYVRDGIVAKPIQFGFLKFSGFGVAGAFVCKVFLDLGCFSSGLGFFLGGTIAAAFFRYVLSPFKPLWNRWRGPEARMRTLCPNVETYDHVVKPLCTLWFNVMVNVAGMKSRLAGYQSKIKSRDRQVLETVSDQERMAWRQRLYRRDAGDSSAPEAPKAAKVPEASDPVADLRDQIIPDIQTFFEAASKATLTAKKMLIEALSSGAPVCEAAFAELCRELDRLAKFDEREQFVRVFSELGDPQLGA